MVSSTDTADVVDSFEGAIPSDANGRLGTAVEATLGTLDIVRVNQVACELEHDLDLVA